jgi:urea transporter/murein DD-endopeptidase MepM/ murein hydrolase activator NlpD
LKKHLLHFTDNLLHSYSTLLFMKSRIVGALLLLCTLFNINIAILGVIAWLTTFAFARFIGIKKEDVVHTVYTYNSLLVGFAIGYLFRITPLSIFLTIGASILTVLLSYTLFTLFNYYLRLPVLNIPFTIVSSIIYLAAVKYSALFVDASYSKDVLNIASLPPVLHGFFSSFGVLLFSPYDIIGIVVIVAILLYSRIIFLLSVVSYFVGISIFALLKGSYSQAISDISSFNFILIGIALGGIFLIPSKRSYILALTGVIISVFILDAVSVFWSTFGIPIFTLPFNLVVLLFVYVLRNVGYPKVNNFIKESPEESLANYLNFSRRFDYFTPQPFLPFSGKWTVYQGFDDKWTHKGHWKYAYDFVITDDDDKTFSEKGIKLADYYCYGKPILSPINGVIVEASDSLRDNAIGTVDRKNNWGNYIIIYSEFGYYVEISHLQTKSLKVKVGDFVKHGTILANCGNSGYSPQPHLHMQIQYLPKLGSETYPFFFSNIKQNNELTKNDLKINMKIEPVSFSRKHNKILQFILDDSFIYEVQKNGEIFSEIEFKIKMLTDGSYFFSQTDTNDRLFFGIENSKFVFYSYDGKRDGLLKYLFYGLPKMPLIKEKGLLWKEELPDELFSSKKGWIMMLIKSFKHNLGGVMGNYKMENDYTIRGEISSMKLKSKIVLDKNKGFREIFVTKDNVEWRLSLKK